MLPITVTVQLAAANDAGIAANQQPGAAGDFTLNGAFVTAGVAILTSAGAARQVLITSAANESAKILTIYGTDANGQAIAEQVIGPNASTATTVQHFRTVTRVAINAAAAGNIRVGTNGVGSSRVIGLDQWAAGVGLQVDVSGTANFTVQSTFDDPNSISAESLTWIAYPAAALAAATASAQGTYAQPPAALRLVVNSGTGQLIMQVRQSLY